MESEREPQSLWIRMGGFFIQDRPAAPLQWGAAVIGGPAIIGAVFCLLVTIVHALHVRSYPNPTETVLLEGWDAFASFWLAYGPLTALLGGPLIILLEQRGWRHRGFYLLIGLLVGVTVAAIQAISSERHSCESWSIFILTGLLVLMTTRSLALGWTLYRREN